MSRIPKYIAGGILFIVTISGITHFSYNFRTSSSAPRSSFQLNVAGETQRPDPSSDGNGFVQGVGVAVEGAKNYWNVVLDKYRSISSDVTDWVQHDASQPASTTEQMHAVSLEERQRAAALWNNLGAIVAHAVPDVSPSANDKAASISTILPNVESVSRREEARILDTPVARRSTTVSERLDNNHPSIKHVTNSFDEVSKFLSYGNQRYEPSKPVVPAVIAPISSRRKVGLSEMPVKDKGNKRLARATADMSVSDTPPASNEPPINYDLVKKYSQRAHYVRNESSLQKLDDENDFPKMHVCVTAGEAYGAAWLATKRHLIYGGVNQFNLTWVNCEMASFTVMGNFRRVMKPTGVGVIMQTLDVLDMSVLHLSTFERSHKRYQADLWPDRRIRKTAWHNIDPVVDAAARVEGDVKARIKYNQNGQPKRSSFAERTIVMMPFLGGAMGAGHSVLSNRYHYLKACFWSIFEFYPHIAMAVTQQSDVTWGKEQSGMPWYDVVLLENLPKSASLPMASVQLTRRMLLSNTWDFDYVYYTESDQILLMRNMETYHQYLTAFPLRVIVPHRLMVYSEAIMEKVHKRTKRVSNPMAKQQFTVDVVPTSLMPQAANLRRSKDEPRGTLNDWRTLSCCMPRQNCIERETWIPINKPDGVPLLNYSGLMVPLGNSNFLMESYRSCQIQPNPLLGETSFCP